MQTKTVGRFIEVDVFSHVAPMDGQGMFLRELGDVDDLVGYQRYKTRG